MRSSRLRVVELMATDIPGIVDEVPVLAIAAAVAEATMVISDAGELRAKKSDRIVHTCGILRAFGVTETEDGATLQPAASEATLSRVSDLGRSPDR
ncbi:hypothetical protein [Streptomyces sp. NPDC014623]|uniref:hypothetical protein n=1 Tax=Streptomyces sp. NPDC014623 TaxID=3364875 RepID=UPI0036FD1BEE